MKIKAYVGFEIIGFVLEVGDIFNDEPVVSVIPVILDCEQECEDVCNYDCYCVETEDDIYYVAVEKGLKKYRFEVAEGNCLGIFNAPIGDYIEAENEDEAFELGRQLLLEDGWKEEDFENRVFKVSEWRP